MGQLPSDSIVFADQIIRRNLLSVSKIESLLSEFSNSDAEMDFADWVAANSTVSDVEIQRLKQEVDTRTYRVDGQLISGLISEASGSQLEFSEPRHMVERLSRTLGWSDLLDTPSQLTDLGRYEVIEKHAAGGLGVVFRASDHDLSRTVALKRIKDSRRKDSASRRRFEREAKITGLLQHASIAPIYSIGSDENGDLFYAMRFIDGATLGERCDQLHEAAARSSGEFQTGLHRLLTALVQACRAVHFAHGHGVIHRDLKPDNIMVSDAGECFVVDWGLARMIGSKEDDEPSFWSTDQEAGTLTRDGAGIGTRGYMSPEQRAGKHSELTAATDVYSLGATLLRIVTNERPSRELALEERRKSPRSLQALFSIAALAMHPLAQNRYGSAADLADDIERFLSDTATRAHGESSLDHVMRFARQNRTLSLITVTAILLLSVAYGLVSRATAEKKIAIADQKAVARIAEISKNSEVLSRARELYRSGSVDASESMLAARLEEVSEPAAELALERGRLLIRMRRFIDADEYLQSLELSGGLAERRDILRGTALYFSDSQAAKQLLASASTAPSIDNADRLFARALLAESLSEQQALLEEVIEAEPWRREAYETILACCVLRGEFQVLRDAALQGQRYFGRQDPMLLSLEYLAEGALGNEIRTKALEAELGKINQGLVDAIGFVTYLTRITPRQKFDNPMALNAAIFGKLVKAIAAFEHLGTQLPSTQYPPALLNRIPEGLRDAVAAWDGDLNAVSVFKIALSLDVANWDEGEEGELDGLFYYAKAMNLYKQGDVASHDTGELERIIALCQQGREAGSVAQLVFIGLDELEVACLADLRRHLGDNSLDGQIIACIRRAWALGLDLSKRQLQEFMSLSAELGELRLARDLLDEYDAHYGRTSNVSYMAGQLNVQEGNWLRALDDFQSVLAAADKNTAEYVDAAVQVDEIRERIEQRMAR